MATIRHISSLVRVSRATVSHVINQTAFVFEELRDRGLKAVRDLIRAAPERGRLG